MVLHEANGVPDQVLDIGTHSGQEQINQKPLIGYFREHVMLEIGFQWCREFLVLLAESVQQKITIFRYKLLLPILPLTIQIAAVHRIQMRKSRITKFSYQK